MNAPELVQIEHLDGEEGAARKYVPDPHGMITK